ncbi:hypothetical protein PAHAL_3G084100 [Panicum hallii]|jgi:hypothetical protein|uniref:TF-B3 domain-containing protein n=1 Tax=Panicum hallii TaxID=206008 RepID=A0A2T8KHI9_9POAL|nr:hypothetical protein PAHAL_3G084100 [Panicum hallii]
MGSSKRRRKNKVNGGVDDDDEASSGSRARDGLLYALVQRLQVCRPVLVLRKALVRSYLSRQQNYLGITPAEYDRGFRRPGLLTGDEHSGVHRAGGLPVRALDRRGVEYVTVLAHLKKTYRLRAGWGGFLRNAGLLQDDDRHVGDVVEVWAFRSPAWGAKLGLVLLHYTKEEDAQMTMAVASRGYRRQQVRRLAPPPIVAAEEDDDEEATAMSAAVTLVSMKRKYK